MLPENSFELDQAEQDALLFQQRPVSLDAINRLRELCTNPHCDQIECLALKAALAAYDVAQDLYDDCAGH